MSDKKTVREKLLEAGSSDRFSDQTVNDKFRSDPQSNRVFLQEKLIMDITEKVCEVLEQTELTRAALAARLDVPEDTITDWLNGHEIDLRNASDMFWALGVEVSPIEVSPDPFAKEWP